jgi:hypothetical protein
VQEKYVIEEILRVSFGHNNINFSNKFNATVANPPRNEDYKIAKYYCYQLNLPSDFYEMMVKFIDNGKVMLRFIKRRAQCCNVKSIE